MATIAATNRRAQRPRSCPFDDETGGRRFWPVKTGSINVEALARDRDQLLAEAVKAYHDGEQWWPDRAFEHEYVVPEQEARFEADAWEENIADYLRTISRTTVGQVAKGALSMEAQRIGTADQRRITAAMERLGWRRERPDGGTDWQGKRWWIAP
jgi:predicted P-loop ATPase